MKNKLSHKEFKILIITSIITILPIFAAFILWPQVNDIGRKTLSFVLPALMLFVEWFLTHNTKKSKELDKSWASTMWVLTISSLLISVMLHLTALKYELSIQTFFPLFVGLLFILIGNYMPKNKEVPFAAMIIPWAWIIGNKNSWNEINRFTGKIWFVGGIAIVLTVFCQSIAFLYVDVILMIIMIGMPIIYSYLKCGKKKTHIKKEMV